MQTDRIILPKVLPSDIGKLSEGIEPTESTFDIDDFLWLILIGCSIFCIFAPAFV